MLSFQFDHRQCCLNFPIGQLRGSMLPVHPHQALSLSKITYE